MNKILLKAKENMLLKEEKLSKYACKSQEGIWLKDDEEDIRPIFYRDIDRIIHSFRIYKIYRQNTGIFFYTK